MLLPLHWVLQCRLTAKKHCTSFLMSSMFSLSSLLPTLRLIFRLRDSHLYIYRSKLQSFKAQNMPRPMFSELLKRRCSILLCQWLLKLNFFPAKRDPSAALNCGINVSPPLPTLWLLSCIYSSITGYNPFSGQSNLVFLHDIRNPFHPPLSFHIGNIICWYGFLI